MADAGRPVPPHGSGGAAVPQRADPDETPGRALYRARADAEAARPPMRRARLAASSSPHGLRA